MSNKYKHGDRIPNEVLCARLQELVKAITTGEAAVMREFSMRIPVELDRDADCVLSDASRRITDQNAEIERLREGLKLIASGLDNDGQYSAGIELYKCRDIANKVLENEE